MIAFSQQDPRWAQKKYNNGYTYGRYGCTITCLAMVRNWFYGVVVFPDWVGPKLTYTSGMIIWSSLANIGLRLVERVRVRNDVKIRAALASPSQCCIVEVNHNHWLFVVGRYIPVLGYRVIDPWRGDYCYTNRYGNNITGCAIISK